MESGRNPEELPEILYHYTDASGVVGIAKSKSLWASNIHYLSDAKEFKHAREITYQVLLGRLNTAQADSEKLLLNQLATDLQRIESLNVAVFCLTERGDLLSQWRGYCPDGGYSVGFESSAVKEVASRQQFYLARCIYDGAKQREILEWVIDQAFAYFRERVDQPEWSGRLDSLMEQTFSVHTYHFALNAPRLKDQPFREEREWRIISRGYNSDDPRLGFRQRKEMLVPYLPISFSGEPEGLPVKDVVIGPMSHQYLAGNSMRDFLSSLDVRFQQITYSQIPYRNW